MTDFRRDVVQDIRVNVPQTPRFPAAPQGTGDDVADALNVAAFGLQLYQQSQQQSKAQAQQVREEELLGMSQNITSELLDLEGQRNLSEVERQMFIDDKVRGSTSSPLERQMMFESIAKQISSSTFSDVIEEARTEEDELDDSLRDIPIEMQAAVFQGANIDQMTKEQKREKMDIYRNLAKASAETSQAKAEMLGKPTVQSFNNFARSLDGLLIGQQAQTLHNLVIQVEQAGGSAEQVQLLQQARKGLQQIYQTTAQQIEGAYSEAISNPNLGKDELAVLKAQKDNLLSRTQRHIDNVQKMDDEQFKSLSQMSDKLKAQYEIELHESIPELLRLKDALGPAYTTMMDIMVAQNPKLRTMTVDRIGNAVSEGLVDLLPAQAGLAQSTDLKQLGLMMTGKGIEEFDAEVANEIAAQRWSMLSDVVVQPASIDAMNDDQIQATGLAMIGVLDRAQEVGDVDSIRHANRLLASPSTEKLLARLPEEQQAIMANYLATSSAEVMKDHFRSFPETKYDAGSGKVSVPEGQGAAGARRPTRQTISQAAMEAARQSTVSRQKNLQAQVDQTAKLMVKYHPAIDNMKQARDYLFLDVSKDRVTGPLTQFTDPQVQAIQEVRAVQDVEEALALETRVQEFQQGVQQTNEQLEAQIAQLQAQLEAQRGNQ